MKESVSSTIKNIAHRWDSTNRSILAEVLLRLVRGSALPIDNLAVSIGFAADEVDRQLELAGADRGHDGDVTGLAGISVVDGPFHLIGAGFEIWTCCAVTAHAASIIRGDKVDIETRDPLDESKIRLSVSPAGVVSMSPASICATLIPLDDPQTKAGLSERFCRFTRYFRSSDSAGRSPSGGRQSIVLSPAEVHEAALLWARLVWGIEIG